MYQYWHGVDFNVNARLTNGFVVQGGTSTGRGVRDNCEITAKCRSPAGAAGSSSSRRHRTSWLTDCAVSRPTSSRRSTCSWRELPVQAGHAGSWRQRLGVQRRVGGGQLRRDERGRGRCSAAQRSAVGEPARPRGAVWRSCRQVDLRAGRSSGSGGPARWSRSTSTTC